MKKRIIISLIAVCVLFISFVAKTYAIFKIASIPNIDIASASWNVSLNQTGVDGALAIIPEILDDSYVLHITNQSQLDVVYSIVIRGLPSGVQAKVDNGSFQSQIDNKISFANVGTILYTNQVKTNDHTITFTGTSSATVVNNQNVYIDVIVKQIV